MLASFIRRTQRHAPLRPCFSSIASNEPYRRGNTWPSLTLSEEAKVMKELDAIKTNLESTPTAVSVDYWRDVGRTLGKCRSSDLLEAARPLVTKTSLLASPVGVVHNEMIRILLNLGLLDDVIAMAKSGALPLTSRTVSRILGACVRESNKDKFVQGFELFDLACTQQQQVPHMSTFHSLFILCAKSNDQARLAQVKRYMQQHNVALDAVCHGICLRMDCRAGNVTEAIARYHQLTRDGMTLPVNHLNDFLDDLTESDHYDDAVQIFETAQTNMPIKPWGKAPPLDETAGRLPLNVISYNIMIKLCGKEHRMDEAFKWYEAMKATGLKPSTVTINTMLHGVFHGQFRTVNAAAIYSGLAGLGAIVATALYSSDLSESTGAIGITSAVAASMAVGIYVNPFGVKKAIYPNESGQREPIPQAILRRLDEEEHIGRLMFLWQELLGYGLTPDLATFDILVRTCVRKRHPELAATVLLDATNPNSIVSRRKAKGPSYHFELSLATTVQLLQALVAQNLLPLFDQVFTLANGTHRFQDITKRVPEKGGRGGIRYTLGVFQTPKATALALVKLLNPHMKHSMPSQPISFEVQNSHAVLDVLDAMYPATRALFVMEDVQGAGHGLGVLPLNRHRLQAHFKSRHR